MPNPVLAKLQQQLREKFPMAHYGVNRTSARSAPTLDLRDPATFPRGAITEIVPAHPASGLSLVVAALLEQENVSAIPELALIDGRDSFDPASFASVECSKLLWIRCQTPEQSIKAADLILRDGNVPRVVIDLLAFPGCDLRKIPNSSWQRLKQLIEVNDVATIALCPLPLIPCARMRLSMQSGFRLDHLDLDRSELIRQLRGTPTLQRKHAQ